LRCAPASCARARGTDAAKGVTVAFGCLGVTALLIALLLTTKTLNVPMREHFGPDDDEQAQIKVS